MQSYVECSWREGIGDFQNHLWKKDSNDSLPWQKLVTETEDGGDMDPLFARSFDGLMSSGCQQADVMIWQYIQEEGGLDWFLAAKERYPDTPILTEIDDNILSVLPLNGQAFYGYSPRSAVRQRVLQQLRSSDGVIVSTPYLKEVLSEFNDRIYIVENGMDFKSWDKLKRKSKGGVRIGWAGGSGHEGDFEEYIPAIKNIAKSNKEVKFILINGPAINGMPKELQNIPRIQHKLVWKPIGAYPQMLVYEDFDILIAPLQDCAFNRAKSNLKWLEGAALCIPTVASSVGHMKDTITHGVDGFLAETPEEFEKFINILIKDKKLRRQMGREARKTAEKRFSIEAMTRKYLSVMEDVVALKRGPTSFPKEAIA